MNSFYASAIAAAARPPKVGKSKTDEKSTASDWKPEVALAIANDPTKCILPDGRIEHVATADLAGFFVLSADRQAEIRETAEAKVADASASLADRMAAKRDLDALRREDYAHAIRSLPEARSRPGAATRIIAAHNERSLPLPRAAAFLANLPPEVGSPVASTSSRVKPAMSLKRRAELALANATTRANLGNSEARRRADGIASALRLHAEQGTDLARALEVSLINPATL